MPFLTNSIQSFRSWWEGATPSTRAAAAGLGLAVVIGLIVAASMASGPNYTPIFHGVSGKDASAIENVLHDHSIQMRFDDKDGTVSVPAKDESNATMYVEAAGILSKDAEIVGIEALDKIGMGTSSDVERQRILESDEGEMDRKLMQLEPVELAATTISPGNTSSLFGNDIPPSASIILTLKPGEFLDPLQVKGIVYTIANAYTGLTPHNVSLVDQSGTPLWKDNGTGENALGDGQPLDESAKYSSQVKEHLQNLLDSTFGPHKALVTVDAELDFDQKQIDSISHTPAPGMRTGLPVSVRDQTESYTGSGGAGAGGAAGTASNVGIPSYAGSSGTSGGGNYKKEDTVTNYDNDVTHTITQAAPGSVKRLAVAALVDTSVPAGDIDKIKAFLGTAIGVLPGDVSRTVTVQQIAFDTSAIKAQQTQLKELASQQLMENIAKAAAACIIGAILLFMLMRSSGRSVQQPQLALAGNGANIGLLEATPDHDLETMLEERPLSIEDVLSEMPDTPPRRKRRRMLAPAIEEQQDLKLESIQDMINTSPEAVALLMKGWMAEEARLS